MATLGGDLLRLLAHTVLQTGGNLGVDYLKRGWEEQAREKLMGLETARESAAVEPDPTKQQEVLRQLQGKLNLPMVTERGFAPTGEAPTLANLGTRQNLTYPSSSYMPAAVERIMAPVPKLETLRAQTAQQMPQERREAALYPKETTLEAAQYNTLATLAARAQEGELNRAQREAADIRHDETLRLNQLSRSEDRRMFYGLLKEKYATGGEQKYIDQLDNINRTITDYIGTSKWDSAEAAASQYNTVRSATIAKFPHLTDLLPEITITKPSGWVPFLKTPGKAEYPTKPTKKPSGPTPPTLPTSIPLPDGGVATKTDKVSRSGQPLYQFPDGSLRPYLGGP